MARVGAESTFFFQVWSLVAVLFVGDAADKDRVQQAIAPSGADFRFAQM